MIARRRKRWYSRLHSLRTPTTTPRRRRPPSYFCAGPFFDAVSPARQEAPWPLRSLLLLPQCMVEAGPALRTSASAELAAQLGRDDCTFEGVCIRLQKTALGCVLTVPAVEQAFDHRGRRPRWPRAACSSSCEHCSECVRSYRLWIKLRFGRQVRDHRFVHAFPSVDRDGISH